MITGELEYLYGLDNDYDHFFKNLFGKKKDKKKKNAFWEKVRQEYENAGKLEGILHTASDVEAYLQHKKEQREANKPNDFKIGLGEKKEDQSNISTGKIIGVTLLAIGFTGALLYANNKLNNKLKGVTK